MTLHLTGAFAKPLSRFLAQCGSNDNLTLQLEPQDDGTEDLICEAVDSDGVVTMWRIPESSDHGRSWFYRAS